MNIKVFSLKELLTLRTVNLRMFHKDDPMKIIRIINNEIYPNVLVTFKLN